MPYYRREKPRSNVVHTQDACRHLKVYMLNGNFSSFERKPSHCTVCDVCQAISKRLKKAVVK